MYANYLEKKLKDVADVYGVCPGPVNTDITRNSPWWFGPFGKFLFTVLFQSRFRGGQHLMYVCCKPAKLMPSGTYHWMRFEKPRSKPSLNEQNIKELMNTTQQWIIQLNQKYQKKLDEMSQ
ncbi:hypothetical protein RFI_15922 [Reticulomyxa filosa]|uniref:Uncharacterized protein n=1 Tax=Reticulomyxa filosa TaxID=46433 RepID=X6N698_RETFI|nr:hypothetical protein RFI_15922 [Reticulomyxa filosa]|eukprot:ETO21284.1 hypothetical protein RFI_15922 [Reticulomyxa filosa]